MSRHGFGLDLVGLSRGAGVSSSSNILKQLQEAQAAANRKNERRYQDILGMYKNLGEAGMTRIGQQEQQQLAQGEQDLTSRGLGNTTIRGSMARGISSEAELNRQQLQESVAMQKGGVMERKTEAGPDLGMYTNLISQAQQAPQAAPQRFPGVRGQFARKRLGL